MQDKKLGEHLQQLEGLARPNRDNTKPQFMCSDFDAMKTLRCLFGLKVTHTHVYCFYYL